MAPRFFLAICLMSALACSPQKTKPFVNEYRLTGAVLRLDPKTQVAAIEHQAITDAAGKVWMEAMTMEFPVKDPAEFAKLQPGQRIRATVYQRPADLDYWIGSIRPEPK